MFKIALSERFRKKLELWGRLFRFVVIRQVGLQERVVEINFEN